MENKHQKQPEGGAGGYGGMGKWIWIILAAAIVTVLVARNVKRTEAPSAPAAATATNVQAAAPVPPAAPEADKGQSLPRLVDLGATKCIPCKMMAPILADLKKTYAGKLTVDFIDVWEKPDAGGKYGIKVIPTQIFYDATGKELFRHEGFYGKEDILAKWKELGVNLPAASP